MNAGPHSVVQPASWALHVLAPVHLQTTARIQSQFPGAQKMTAFLAHETKPRRSKRRIRLSKFALRLLPSSQFGIELRPVFLKLSMTADPPNYERRRNLHKTGGTSRLVRYRRSCPLREASKDFFYAHL